MAKRPTVVQKLAHEVHDLLAEVLLCTPPPPDRFRPRPERLRVERLVAGILRILSKRYFRQELLFRDYNLREDDLWITPTDSDGVRVFKPALDYVALVLSRRLTLANNLKDRPTNMHGLLAQLAAHGPAGEGWPAVTITRSPTPAAPCDAPFFAPIARILADQVKNLGDDMTPIATRRREAYGPVQLRLPCGGAEVAEELTLWDCVAAQPAPLAGTPDRVSRDRLGRVLESLNERYASLRACGLDPAQWYDDASLSIQRLHDLADLRRHAEEHSTAISREAAFARAFAERPDPEKPLAGFATFADFAASPVGEQMIHRGPRSTDQPRPGKEGDTWHADLADAGAPMDIHAWHAPNAPQPDTEDDDQDPPDDWDAGTTPEEDPEEGFLYLFERCPRIRNDPLLDYVLRETLIGRRTLHGPRGLLADPELHARWRDSGRAPAADDRALLDILRGQLAQTLEWCGRQVP